MAKAALLASSPGQGVPKKGQARGSLRNNCTLLDLCSEDKAKVAKLIHQVMDLGKELKHCKSKAAQDLQDRTQHLRQRNTAVCQENHMLKAKLTHAFTLLRTYQHKVQALESANPATLLHAAHPAAAQEQHQPAAESSGRYRQEVADVQPNIWSGAAAAADNAGKSHKQHHSHSQHIHVSPHKHGKHRRRQCSTKQYDSGADVQCEQHHMSQQQSTPLLSHMRPAVTQQGTAAFADLAAQTLAWQQGEAAAASLSDNLDASKVLRFDPMQGPDGGFYFESWDSSHSSAKQSQVDQDAQLAPGLQHEQQQHSLAFAGLASEDKHQVLQAQTKVLTGGHHPEASPSHANQVTQALTQTVSGHMSRDVASAQMPAVSQIRTQEQSGSSSVAGSAAMVKAAEHVAAAASSVTAAAAAAFPIQGGGEAGVLLRAAAAAASGCSHELVMAAAGRCDSEPVRTLVQNDSVLLPGRAAASAQQTPGFEQQLAQPLHDSATHPAQSDAVMMPPTTSTVQCGASTCQPAAVAPQPGPASAQQKPPCTQLAANSVQHIIPLTQPVIPTDQPAAAAASPPLPAASSAHPSEPTSTAPLAIQPGVHLLHQLAQPPGSAAVLMHDSNPKLVLVGSTAEVVEHNIRPHAAESADHGELGFDSSLMDLVAEVEQMVTCNMHASGQASVHSSRSSVLSPMLTTRSLGCQQQALAQQPTYNLAAASVQAGAYGGLFEENDVVSMISDQEYGAYQQY